MEKTYTSTTKADLVDNMIRILVFLSLFISSLNFPPHKIFPLLKNWKCFQVKNTQHVFIVIGMVVKTKQKIIANNNILIKSSKQHGEFFSKANKSWYNSGTFCQYRWTGRRRSIFYCGISHDFPRLANAFLGKVLLAKFGTPF